LRIIKIKQEGRGGESRIGDRKGRRPRKRTLLCTFRDAEREKGSRREKSVNPTEVRKRKGRNYNFYQLQDREKGEKSKTEGEINSPQERGRKVAFSLIGGKEKNS